MSLKWSAVALSASGIALLVLSHFLRLQGVNEAFLGGFFLFLSVAVWLVVLVRWLMGK